MTHELTDRLHAAIMNLPHKCPDDCMTPTERMGYGAGHRDARHAAAELVLAHLAQRGTSPDLRAMLVKARAGLSNGLWDYGPGQDEHEQCDALIAEIDAVLAASPQAQPMPEGVKTVDGGQR